MRAPTGEPVTDADGLVAPRWLRWLTTVFQPLSATLTLLAAYTVTNLAAWTPIVASGTGSITTLGTVTAEWMQFGKFVFFDISIAITTNGTAATYISFTLPVTSVSTAYIAVGRETTATGKELQCQASNPAIIQFYDGTYPGGSGNTLCVTGFYKVA